MSKQCHWSRVYDSKAVIVHSPFCGLNVFEVLAIIHMHRHPNKCYNAIKALEATDKVIIEHEVVIKEAEQKVFDEDLVDELVVDQLTNDYKMMFQEEAE